MPSISKTARVQGVLLGGALGDAVCEMQGYFVASSPRLRVGSATQQLSYSVAGTIEGGIHGPAKGIGGDEDAHVGYALINWLHTKRVPWSEIEMDNFHRYRCALLHMSRSA